MISNKEEILNFLKQNISFLKKEFHVSKIGLFGSFSRDEQVDNSDIDILFDLENDIENIHELKNSLRLYLSQSFGRNVDLAREKYLKPYAKKHILKDVIYV